MRCNKLSGRYSTIVPGACCVCVAKEQDRDRDSVLRNPLSMFERSLAWGSSINYNSKFMLLNCRRWAVLTHFPEDRSTIERPVAQATATGARDHREDHWAGGWRCIMIVEQSQGAANSIYDHRSNAVSMRRSYYIFIDETRVEWISFTATEASAEECCFGGAVGRESERRGVLLYWARIR